MQKGNPCGAPSSASLHVAGDADYPARLFRGRQGQEEGRTRTKRGRTRKTRPRTEPPTRNLFPHDARTRDLETRRAAVCVTLDTVVGLPADLRLGFSAPFSTRRSLKARCCPIPQPWPERRASWSSVCGPTLSAIFGSSIAPGP